MDATDGRNGEAERTVWGTLVEMVLDLAKAFERVLRVLCGYFEHQRSAQFEGCVAEPLQTITAILLGSKWSCLLLRIVLQDALSEVTQIFPPLKLLVFEADITAFMNGRNKELVEMAEKVFQEVEVRGRGEGLEAVDHWRRKRKKEQGNHFLQVSGGEVSGMQQKKEELFWRQC